MTEITVSAKIPKILEKELEEYMKKEHLEKSAAIRRLLFKSLQEWKEEYAIQLLVEGKITLLKASEIAGLDIWEFTAKIKKDKIRWVSEDIIRKDLEAFR